MKKAFNERPQGALPSNTIPNPQEEVKVITTQSGMTLAGPSVPPPPHFSSSKEVERDSKSTMDQVHITSSESTVRVSSLIVHPSLASKSNDIPKQNPHQPPIPYPSGLNKDKLQDKSDIQIHKSAFNKGASSSSIESSDEELEAPIEDQPLPTDASPTALLPGYIDDSNLEEDEEDLEEDPVDYPANGGDNDDNESSDDDDDDDDVEKDGGGLFLHAL
nr:reverse transcriptase domain-containing protein [Tanacetum cinerariifolium]